MVRRRVEFARSGRMCTRRCAKVVELNKEEGLKGDKDGKQFEMEETLMYSEFVEV
jgi:hypothetical protein